MEAELGAKLPAEYLAFQRHYNGLEFDDELSLTLDDGSVLEFEDTFSVLAIRAVTPGLPANLRLWRDHTFCTWPDRVLPVAEGEVMDSSSEHEVVLDLRGDKPRYLVQAYEDVRDRRTLAEFPTLESLLERLSAQA